MSKNPELIAVVRRCAAEGLSAAEAAAQLTSTARVLTRSAIIGMAHRNGIRFHGKRQRQPRLHPKHRPVRVRHVRTVALPTFEKSEPVVTVARKLVNTKLPLACSWQGCLEAPEDGNMFCRSHGRKSLI